MFVENYFIIKNICHVIVKVECRIIKYFPRKMLEFTNNLLF